MAPDNGGLEDEDDLHFQLGESMFHVNFQGWINDGEVPWKRFTWRFQDQPGITPLLTSQDHISFAVDDQVVPHRWMGEVYKVFLGALVQVGDW